MQVSGCRSDVFTVRGYCREEKVADSNTVSPPKNYYSTDVHTLLRISVNESGALFRTYTILTLTRTQIADPRNSGPVPC